MNTFIRAIEVWRPSDDGMLLEFGGGLFGNAIGFAAISRSMCFGRGEGLPGQAWEEGRPVMLKHFEGSNFRRSTAAKAAGLRCALALPIFVGERLTAVLAFFCGDTNAHAGALELWRNDPRATGDLTLVDGYYGSDGAALEAVSRDAYLPKGSGLPGVAWQRGTAVFIADIGASARFLRTQAATDLGIDRGLAIPCTARGDTTFVASFLSAPATPIAQRIERWLPDAARGQLQRADGFCEGTGPLPSAPAAVEAGDAGGSIGRAFASGVPMMAKAVIGEPEAIAAVAAAAGVRSLAAIPVVVDGAVVEVVALYF